MWEGKGLVWVEEGGEATRGGGGHRSPLTKRVPKLSGSWLSWLQFNHLCVREEGVTGERPERVTAQQACDASRKSQGKQYTSSAAVMNDLGKWCIARGLAHEACATARRCVGHK